MFVLMLAIGLVPITALTNDRAQSNPYSMDGLVDTQGDPRTLSELAGPDRLVVVVLKTVWCPACVGQLHRLKSLRTRFAELGVKVVALSTDPPTAMGVMTEGARLPWAAVSDTDHQVIEAMGLWREDWGHPLPSIVIYDRCGKEYFRQEGRTPDSRPEPAVLAALEQLHKDPEKCRDLAQGQLP